MFFTNLLWGHIECLSSHVYLLVHIDARNDKKHLDDNDDDDDDVDKKHLDDSDDDDDDDVDNDDDDENDDENWK